MEIELHHLGKISQTFTVIIAFARPRFDVMIAILFSWKQRFLLQVVLNLTIHQGGPKTLNPHLAATLKHFLEVIYLFLFMYIFVKYRHFLGKINELQDCFKMATNSGFPFLTTLYFIFLVTYWFQAVFGSFPCTSPCNLSVLRYNQSLPPQTSLKVSSAEHERDKLGVMKKKVKI